MIRPARDRRVPGVHHRPRWRRPTGPCVRPSRPRPVPRRPHL